MLNRIGRIRVGVIGHGTIGRRVASAVARQADMTLSGVVARRLTPRLHSTVSTGVDLYSDDDPASFASAGLAVSGRMVDLLARIDVIVDCGPRGTGRDRQSQYTRAGVAAVFQGGEAADVAGCDFTTVARSSEPQGASLRVTSCNTTGLARIVAALHQIGDVLRVTAVLVRAASDSDKASKGSPNAVLAHLGPTHHAEDLAGLFPGIAFETAGCHVPTNRGHLAHVFVEWDAAPPPHEVAAKLSSAEGVRLCREGGGGLDDLGRIADYSGDAEQVLVWERSLRTKGNRTSLAAAIHMEAVVIPDTLEAIRFIAASRRAKALHTPAGRSARSTC